MAKCPLCWEEKEFFAEYCPNCTHPIGFVMQTVFILTSAIIRLGVLVLILWWIFG